MLFYAILFYNNKLRFIGMYVALMLHCESRENRILMRRRQGCHKRILQCMDIRLSLYYGIYCLSKRGGVYISSCTVHNEDCKGFFYCFFVAGGLAGTAARRKWIKYSNRKGLGFSLTRMPYKPIA